MKHPPVEEARSPFRQPGRLARPGMGQRRPRLILFPGAPATRTLALALAWLGVLGASPGFAEDLSRQQMQGLDEQVQEIKSDVLEIAAELNQLEETLLYPSNTQLAVFVSLAEGESFRLDSVQILVDGEPVARHVYSFKEFEALQKGGVQRIYTGNISTGQHQLEVSVAGVTPGGDDFTHSESFGFSKDVEPKLVGVTLAADNVQLGAW